MLGRDKTKSQCTKSTNKRAKQLVLPFCVYTLGDIIMMALGFLSILSIYYITERLMALKNVSKEDPEFTDQLNKLISEGNTEEALSLCENKNTPLSRMIKKGVLRLDSPINEIYAAIESQGKLEVSVLEKNLTSLATIAGAAPGRRRPLRHQRSIAALLLHHQLVHSQFDIAVLPLGHYAPMCVLHGFPQAVVCNAGLGCTDH